MSALARPTEASLAPDLSDLFAVPAVEVERRDEDTIILRHPNRLEKYDRTVVDGLLRWAVRDPQRVWLAERASVDLPWTTLTFSEAGEKIARIATWLLRREVTDRPVLILSSNSVDTGLLTFACYRAGVPMSTISPSYSLLLNNPDKFKAMVGLIDPGLIYVDRYARYAPALKVLEDVVDCVVVSSDDTLAADNHVLFSDLLGDIDEAVIAKAYEAIEPNTIARLLFTSGSTGLPKAVINTHRNICSNMAARSACWIFLDDGEPLKVLDWLPWSHVFGSNNVALSARNGWTFYLDQGKPTPADIGTTIANLLDVQPSFHNNVPLGYDMLLKEMRHNPALAEAFYTNMKLTFYAASALHPSIWEGLQEMAIAVRGHRVPMITQWGATETGPTSTDSHFVDPRHLHSERSGNIGIPVPGFELKLVRFGDKWEARLRGAGITPGYWKNPEATAKAFDDEGFYKIGDALRFADERNPSEGLYFDGRISEDFKLASGTWVNVGTVRLKGIAALAPVVSDIVVSGDNHTSVGFLLVPDYKACRRIASLPLDMPEVEVIKHPVIREHVRLGLRALKGQGGGSSQYATRARFLDPPPSVSGMEMTDKGYINQRAMLRSRAADVEALKGDDPSLWIGLD